MRFWLCQTPEWPISWTAVDLVAKREYSTAESNTDAEAPVDSVQLIYLHIILLTCWNCVEVLIWICLCGIPFYFHDCVCMCTCIYGRVATWKINTFIFCQLSLHFCLLCPDSQLGGTLISSCETQSGSTLVALRISERGPCQEQRSMKNWCFKWTGFELWCSAFAVCL